MTTPDPVAEHAQARVGSVLCSKWRLDGVLGVGGMATVYAATHRNNHARVAIKVLHTEIPLSSEVVERFLREGYMANSVDHPGTAKVLDNDVTDDGAPFLVMELLDGETIEARWERKQRRLKLSEVLAIVDQILGVLAAAHDKGIVHRDLKPENMFLTRNGELKILDFGIARLRELPADTRTRAGSLLGTPAFMAPEQARGRWDEVDARTDIWALGATLFTLLTGRQVHEAATIQEQLIAAGTEVARSIGTLAPDLPPSIIDLVDRALSFDKEDRWPDARAMQTALRAGAHAMAGAPSLTLPIPSLPRRDSADTAATLVAPLSPASGITSHSYTTAPVTRAATSGSEPKRTSLPLVVVGALVTVMVGAVAFWRWNTTEKPTAELPVAAHVAPTPEAAPPNAPDKPAEASGPSPVTTANATLPKPAPAHPRTPVTGKAGQARPADAADKPADKLESVSPVTQPKPGPSGNPYDRRF